MLIGFIRHGLTPWNEQKRIQGQSDIKLSANGITQVTKWRLPDTLEFTTIHSSPLGRCTQTAALLGFSEPTIDDALMEMNWGQWEGKQLHGLRQIFDKSMRRNEARGMDFQPPGGESPRQVRQRLDGWLKKLQGENNQLVFTHNGVIRAAFSLALDWDMKNDMEFKLNRNAIHLFSYQDGSLSLQRPNFLLTRDS
jgi:probable phosphoglycerate mutase